jgi:hypothetical protein
VKITVGLSRKLGLRDYGSLGASCAIELELPNVVLPDDLAAFQQHVRHGFDACAQSVVEELSRQQVLGKANGATGAPNGQPTPSPAQPSGPPRTNGDGENPANGMDSTRSNRGPSEKQMIYLRQLAKQIPGLGVRRLDSLAQKMCGKPVASLSSFDASQLIDTLKAIKSDEVDLDAVLGEPAP